MDCEVSGQCVMCTVHGLRFFGILSNGAMRKGLPVVDREVYCEDSLKMVNVNCLNCC